MMRPPVPCGVSVQVRIEEEEEEEGSEIFYFSLFIVNLFYLQPFQHEKKERIYIPFTPSTRCACADRTRYGSVAFTVLYEPRTSMSMTALKALGES